MEKREKSVAVFDPVGSFFSVPTLQILFEVFNDMRFTVDVFLRVGSHRIEKKRQVRTYPFPVPLKIWAGDLENTLRNWKWVIKYHAWTGHKKLNTSHYDLVFGVNPEGVIAAHRYWEKTRTPFVYVSFEMFFRDELGSNAHLLEKEQEVSASRDALLVIIQDTSRGNLLCQENGLSCDKIEFLPVAPRGGPIPKRTNYLRERFNIAANKMILLHSGTFQDWTCADELTESLPRWPNNLVLVIHTHYEKFGRGEDPYIRKIKQVADKKVFISNTPLDQKEYQEMICSADAGLVFYKPNHNPPFGGKNIQYIGLSSGKLASYTRCGLPIICGGQLHFKELIQTYKFGEYTNQFSYIPLLAGKIQENWNCYSQEAFRFFAERLDFNIHWPGIWKHIESHLVNS
jgi:hypothetical protein